MKVIPVGAAAALLALAVVRPVQASTPPTYPRAVVTVRPPGVAMKAPPSGSKTYVTADDFVKVKSWYRAHLKGATELAQPGMEKTEDAFLIGQAGSGMVVLIQSYRGKTYIVIGPPT